jgi:hypothetical protein
MANRQQNPQPTLETFLCVTSNDKSPTGAERWPKPQGIGLSSSTNLRNTCARRLPGFAVPEFQPDKAFEMALSKLGAPAPVVAEFDKLAGHPHDMAAP